LNRHAVTDLSLVESDAQDCKSPAPTPGRHHALQTPEAIMYMHVSTFTSALKPSRFEALVSLGHSGTSQQQPPSFHGHSVIIPNELRRHSAACAQYCSCGGIPILVEVALDCVSCGIDVNGALI